MAVVKWQNRFTNFEKSFNTLSEDIAKFTKNKNNLELYNLLRAGLIHVYEHTLELAWKTLKDYLEEQGFTDIASPKKVIRTAFASGYITDGELWLQSLDDRNLITHDYDEDMAQEISQNIAGKYYRLLQDLYSRLQLEANNSKNE